MTQVHEIDVPAARRRHAARLRHGPADGLPVVWHHGTPNIGSPPRPLFAEAERLGLRVGRRTTGRATAARPRVPTGRIGSAAADVAAVVDALGIERFAVMGHSGGGPHALACAALLPDRVPRRGERLRPGAVRRDWARLVRGMADPAALQARWQVAEPGRPSRSRSHQGEPGLHRGRRGGAGGAVVLVHRGGASGAGPAARADGRSTTWRWPGRGR